VATETPGVAWVELSILKLERKVVVQFELHHYRTERLIELAIAKMYAD